MAIEPTPNTIQATNRNPRGAMGYMLIAVFGYSLTPLVIAFASDGSPFLFNAGWRLGLVLGLSAVIAWHRGVFRIPAVRSLVLLRLKSFAIVAAVGSNFDYAMFVLSTRFIDISVATVIFETWPMWMILMLAWIYRKEGRYRRTIKLTGMMVCLCLFGLCFVTISQSEAVFDIVNGQAPGRLLLGSALALSGALVSSLAAFSFKWGTDLAGEIADILKLEESNVSYQSLDLLCLVLAYGLSSSVSVLGSLFIGTVSREPISFNLELLAIIGGMATYAPATIAWRMGNLRSTNLGINIMVYGTPILSLVWFYLLSTDIIPPLVRLDVFNVMRVDYLVIGVAAIITANLLINFEAEIRLGFKALLLALGTCGAIVYLRDGVFEFLGVGQWHWTASGYFESITLAATVFTLLLAFRVARLVSRTSEEDNRTFAIYRKLDMLARRGVINPQVCRYILDIDQARNNSANEREAYTRARRLIAEVDPRPLNEADSQLLSDAEAQLDALARSKQVDIHLGEQFALYIVGGITVGLAILTLPSQVAGWTRLLVDLFAMLISAVIIFLLFHIQDLQRERDDSKFEPAAPQADYRHHLARFLDTQQRSFDQLLSTVVGAAIVLTYAALMAHKWLGWFG